MECIQCGEQITEENHHIRSDKPLASMVCDPCFKFWRKIYRSEFYSNPINRSKKNKQQMDAYYTKYKESRQLSNKKWRDSNPEKVFENKIAKYGMTSMDYYDMLEEQGGACAICKKPPYELTPSNKIKKFAVDHNHSTGQIRGLLCSKCNQAIGLLKEDINLFNAAINYLQIHLQVDQPNPSLVL